MKQKHIGYVLILSGLLVAGLVYMAKANEDRYIDQFIHEEGTCYLDDGTCLHADRHWGIYIAGWAVAGVLLMFGSYLAFVDRSQEQMAQHQEKIAGALQKVKKDEKFGAFLQGFSEDEKKVLKAIREQDGILQSTLRYRTGLSKTVLSIMLKNFEGREIVSRKESGRTKKVYLKKSF